MSAGEARDRLAAIFRLHPTERYAALLAEFAAGDAAVAALARVEALEQAMTHAVRCIKPGGAVACTCFKGALRMVLDGTGDGGERHG